MGSAFYFYTFFKVYKILEKRLVQPKYRRFMEDFLWDCYSICVAGPDQIRKMQMVWKTSTGALSEERMDNYV